MKYIFLIFITISSICLTACVKKQLLQIKPVELNPVKYEDYQNKKNEVISYDRYTLVNVGASEDQRLVLNQIIDISIPSNMITTVSGGMNHLLKQSGFALCQDNLLQQTLFNKPLPLIQYKLGPIRLGDALQIMAGPAFQLTIDNVERNVCFQISEGYSIKNANQEEGDLYE